MPSRQAEALEFLESAYLEKIMETFNFLDHCHDVNELLKVCVEILPTLSPEHQAKLTTELRTFEDFVVPTMWGIVMLKIPRMMMTMKPKRPNSVTMTSAAY